MKILIVDTVSFNRAPYLKWYIDACKKIMWTSIYFFGIELRHHILKKMVICLYFIINVNLVEIK